MPAHPLGMTTPKHNQRLLDAAQAVVDAQTPLEALEANHELLIVLMDVRLESVADARADNEPWAKIGAALGVSKQAVQKIYGLEPDDDTEGDPPPAPTPGKEHIVLYDRDGRTQGYAKKARGPMPFESPIATGAKGTVSDDAEEDTQGDSGLSSAPKSRQPKLTVVNDD